MDFKPKFLACALVALAPIPASAADFPSSCFVETAEFAPEQPGNVTVATDWRDDLFFVQNGEALPSLTKDVVRNVDIPAKLANPPKWKGAVFSNLSDSSSETYVEVPPSVRAEGVATLEFVFDSVLPRGSFRLISEIVGGRHSVEVSVDGKTFVETDERSISNFDAKAVRLVFPKAPEQSSITTIRSFRFVKSFKDTVFVKAGSTSPVTAYRGYRCDEAGIADFRAERSAAFADVDKLKPSDNPVEPVFSPNSAFGEDSDSDGIADPSDNCPDFANANQADRNFDGRGDACSDEDRDGYS